MEPRATTFANCLNAHNVWVNVCMICEQQGMKNVRSDFCGHVISRTHWIHLQGCGINDGVQVELARAECWQAFRIPGGGVRFNHVDGSIDMFHGRGEYLRPASLVPDFVLQIMAPGVTPLPTAGHALQAYDGLPDVAGKWVEVVKHVGEPTKAGGDYRSCGWLASHWEWKKSMREPVDRLCKLLERYKVWPTCRVCEPPCQSFGEHVLASKHYQMLGHKYLWDGQPVLVAAAALWQQWDVPSGAIAFNHVHGQVMAWRHVSATHAALPGVASPSPLTPQGLPPVLVPSASLSHCPPSGGGTVARGVGTCTACHHYYIGDDVDGSGDAGAESLARARWERTQDHTGRAYWRRNTDGWWFVEGDETWQQFLINGLGPCWWHKSCGMWFVARDGFDRGVWIGRE